MDLGVGRSCPGTLERQEGNPYLACLSATDFCTQVEACITPYRSSLASLSVSEVCAQIDACQDFSKIHGHRVGRRRGCRGGRGCRGRRGG